MFLEDAGGPSGKTLEEGPPLGYNGAGFYFSGEVT
jgi:hypothetical protein